MKSNPPLCEGLPTIINAKQSAEHRVTAVNISIERHIRVTSRVACSAPRSSLAERLSCTKSGRCACQACGKAYCSNADTYFLAWIEANPLPEARAHHDSHSQTLLGHSPSHPEHEAHSSIPTGRFSWQATNMLARWCLERYRMQWDDKAYLASDSTGT